MAESACRSCLSRVAGRQPLLRVLAAAGIGSQSRCAGMVRGGLVGIGGKVVRDLQTRVDPFREPITLSGRPLPLTQACRYLLLHKPYGVLSEFSDSEGRPSLADYIDMPGVNAVGRLDVDSEGLLLLSDDGWLIHHLGHPRYEHPKTYLVQVERVPDQEGLAALRRGVVVKGERTAPAQVELLTEEPDLPPRPVAALAHKTVPAAWLRLVLTEGRKHQVRHMTAAVGHPTLRLVRVGLGPLSLSGLQPGDWRTLTITEMEALRAMLHSAPAAVPPRSGNTRRR